MMTIIGCVIGSYAILILATLILAPIVLVLARFPWLGALGTVRSSLF